MDVGGDYYKSQTAAILLCHGQGSTSTSPYRSDLQTTIHLYNLPCFNARHACRKRANTSAAGLAYPTQCQQALLHRSKSSLKTHPTRWGAAILHQHPWTFQKRRRGAIQLQSAYSSSQLHAPSICRSVLAATLGSINHRVLTLAADEVLKVACIVQTPCSLKSGVGRRLALHHLLLGI